MFIKKQQSSPLCHHRERYGAAFWLAFLAACAIFIPFMIEDGGYFLFYGDFNVQQVPFYKLAHQAVREGNFGWHFGTDLGANFIGSYSFYLLGSPFFWLTIPFPNDFVPHLMGPLLILKFACASLTAYAFCSRFVKNKNFAVIGGLLYAFSGFSVYNVFFNHFHEAIIYFPLLLLSLEWLMCRERYWPFIVMVALCALSNYYFFFGMVLFTVIYFLVRITSPDWDMFRRRACIKRDVGRFAVLLAEAVLGLLLSAVLLLPAVMAITDNTRIGSYLTGWNGVVYSRSQIYSYILQCFFFPPDLPARPVFFPDADVKWSSVAGWLPVFGMTGVCAWMASKRKSWQKRLITVSAIFAFVPILNSAFSAFNYSYYARWFYMPILIMVLMTVMGMEDREVEWNVGWKWSAGITLSFVLLVGLFPQGQDDQGNFTGFGLYSEDYADRFLVTCLIAVVCLVLTFLLLFVKKRWTKDFSRVSIALILVVSVVYSSYFISMGKTSSYDPDDFIIPHLLENEEMVLEDADGEEKPSYQIDDVRIDVYESMDNTGMFLGMSSINAFHSIVPGSVMEFYNFVGVERTVASRPYVTDFALRSFLSVKYLLDYADDSQSFQDDYGTSKMPGWSVYSGVSQDELTYDKEDTKQNGYYIYQNDYFIPYGFTYDYYMTRAYADTLTQDERQEMLLKAMVLDEEQVEKYGDMLTDLESEDVDYASELTYQFYYNNCRDRAANACHRFETTQNGFTAKIVLEKDNLVFFSIPYDAGWSATVDGKPVDVEKVNVGFMAVPVSGDGQEHTIEFTYETPGLEIGMIVSGCALLLTALFLWLITRKKGEPIPWTLNQPEEEPVEVDEDEQEQPLPEEPPTDHGLENDPQEGEG